MPVTFNRVKHHLGPQTLLTIYAIYLLAAFASKCPVILASSSALGLSQRRKPVSILAYSSSEFYRKMQNLIILFIFRQILEGNLLFNTVIRIYELLLISHNKNNILDN